MIRLPNTFVSRPTLFQSHRSTSHKLNDLNFSTKISKNNSCILLQNRYIHNEQRRVIHRNNETQIRNYSFKQQKLFSTEKYSNTETNLSPNHIIQNNQNTFKPSKKKSFYRKPLPTHLTPFSSTKGKTIFREAMQSGYLEGYFSLAEQYNTQSEPAFCGLGSLTMILNALQLDPDRLWKGPWRWFSEEMLDCCKPLSIIKETGTTLSEFSCLARCNGAAAETTFADMSSESVFRNAIKRVTSSEDQFMVVSFDRSSLKQTGHGHFSPIAAYHPEQDLVLVLDVARFKYPSYWVKVSELWEALLPLDHSTSRSRGYVVLSRPPISPPILYRIRMPRQSFSTRYQSCQRTARKLFSQVFAHQVQREASSASNAESLVRNVLSMLPRELVDKFETKQQLSDSSLDNIHEESISCRYNVTHPSKGTESSTVDERLQKASLGIRIECQCSKTHSEAVGRLLTDIQQLKLFSIVQRVLSTRQSLLFNNQKDFSCHEPEVLTVFILSLLAPHNMTVQSLNDDSIPNDSSLEQFEHHLQSIDLSALYHSDDQAVIQELNLTDGLVPESVQKEVIAVRHHLDVLADSMDEGLSDNFDEKECPSSGLCCHDSENSQNDQFISQWS